MVSITDDERGETMSKTIVQKHSKNFETLQRAFALNAVCLLECKRIDTGEVVAVLCAMNHEENGDISFTPFAQLFNGNPYEMLTPPDPDGGFYDGEGGKHVHTTQ
jgi:hypothetical protein